MSDKQQLLNSAFLVEMFRFAEHSLFLTTLPNERGQHGNRHERRCIATETLIRTNVERVIEKYDRDGQALYFCASTIDDDKVEARCARALKVDGKEPQSERSKETIGEIVALWVDIDLKNIKLGKTELYRRLALLRLLPTVVVDSGNGAHVWYFLNEAMPATPETVCELETLLGQMCFSLGGDKSCCEVARLMRLPGSHNTKNGAFKPVNVQEDHSDYARRYDFEELREFWRDEPRVLQDDEIILVVDKRTGRARRQADGDEPENAFAAFVRSEISAGRVHLPPLDVDKLLGSMVHGGGENGVHNTMLAVTSSLVSRGWAPDEIIDFVLKGVGKWVSANGLPQGWPDDWDPMIESRARAQISGAVRKADPEKLVKARERRAAEVRRPQLALVDASADTVVRSSGQVDIEVNTVDAAHAVGAAVASGGANVVEFKIERRKQGQGRPKKGRPAGGPDHVQLAGLALERISMTGRRICFWRGELWIYSEGIWSAYDGKDQNSWLETEIHATVRAVNDVAADLGEGTREDVDMFDEDSKLRVETRRYIQTMPELRFSGAWDDHGLTPLANGLFDPASRTLKPYEPIHRATFRFAAYYDPAATFNHGRQMIEDMFKAYGPDMPSYVRLFKQFAYVAMFKAKQKIGRKLRRCLYLQGESNSGKSELVNLLRLAVGVEHCSSTTLIQLSDKNEGRFALQPLMNKALWAADEVVTENTKVDAGRIKALLAEDMIQADKKGAAQIEARYLGSAIFSANNPPRTSDTGDGFAERFMFVHCPADFDKEFPSGIALLAKERGYEAPSAFIAATELGGLVNWALEERDFIERELRFEQPVDVIMAREEMRDDNAPLRTFLKECLEIAPMSCASKANDIYEAYKQWHLEDNNDTHFCVSQKRLWRSMNDFYKRKRGYVPRTVIKPKFGSFIVGVKLNKNGIDYWASASKKKEAGDKEIKLDLSMSEHSLITAMDPEQIAKAAKFFKCPDIETRRDDEIARF